MKYNLEKSNRGIKTQRNRLPRAGSGSVFSHCGSADPDPYQPMRIQGSGIGFAST